MKRIVYVYTLSDKEENIKYVGITTRLNLKKRLKEHIYESKTKTNTHKLHWIQSLDEDPEISLLDIVKIEEWEFWEQYWISQMKAWGFKLTNLTHGGRGQFGNTGWKHSEETKKKIKLKNSGENNYNYGKTLSDEWKRKISESTMGIKNHFYGKKHSEDSLKKMSKKVIQYDLDGNFIKEWKSIKEIKTTLKIFDISPCCHGKLNSSGGFQWRFKSSNLIKKIKPAKPYRKKVAQIDCSNNKIVKIWNSIRKAESELNIHHISKVCSDNPKYKSYKTSGGFKWKYYSS